MSVSTATVPARESCAQCERRLTVHEVATGGVCGNPSCRNTHLKRRLADEARERELTLARLDAVRRLAMSSSAIEQLESYPLAVLPANVRALTELPSKRRREFESYLKRSIAAARASAVEPPAIHDEPAGSTSKLLGHACGTCRGECCDQGDTHAFLNPKEIGLLMAGQPDRGAEQTLEDYLTRLGGKTYRDACVFQGEYGCRLPREMRSRICNEFECREFSAVLWRLSESDEHRAFAGAVSAGRVVRAAAIDGDRVLLEIDPVVSPVKAK